MSESKLIFIDEARIASHGGELSKQGGSGPPPLPLREINIATMGGSRTDKPPAAHIVVGGGGGVGEALVEKQASAAAAAALVVGGGGGDGGGEGLVERPAAVLAVGGGGGLVEKPASAALVAGGGGALVDKPAALSGGATETPTPSIASFGGGSLYLPGSPASSEASSGASSPRASSLGGGQGGGGGGGGGGAGSESGESHGGAMEGEKEDDKWSISTDELMGMSPYYMILEKFFKHQNHTTAQLLREILDEVKGLRQDLRVANANGAN